MPKRRQTSKSAKRKRVVHPDMNVSDIVALHDGAAEILSLYGLHCVGCSYNELETLREGADAHGLTDDDLSNLITDLTELLATVPPKPKILTITEAAAHALLTIAQSQQKEGWFLRVTSDEAGGFCMEFEEKNVANDHTFGHPNVPQLILIASTSTLARIGGSTIDHRDGRFKLDLLIANTCGCNKKTCGCEKK